MLSVGMKKGVKKIKDCFLLSLKISGKFASLLLEDSL